jgi:hypothetical protein
LPKRTTDPRAAEPPQGESPDGPKVMTPRLGAEPFRQLEPLAAAESRSPTDFAETLVPSEPRARSAERRVITMRVAPEAVRLEPGPLLRSEGEQDGRYAGREALFAELLRLPDAG